MWFDGVKVHVQIAPQAWNEMLHERLGIVHVLRVLNDIELEPFRQGFRPELHGYIQQSAA